MGKKVDTEETPSTDADYPEGVRENCGFAEDTERQLKKRPGYRIKHAWFDSLDWIEHSIRKVRKKLRNRK